MKKVARSKVASTLNINHKAETITEICAATGYSDATIRRIAERLVALGRWKKVWKLIKRGQMVFAYLGRKEEDFPKKSTKIFDQDAETTEELSAAMCVSPTAVRQHIRQQIKANKWELVWKRVVLGNGWVRDVPAYRRKAHP